MSVKFKTIGIIGKPNDESISETLVTLFQFLKRENYQVIIAENSAKFIAQAIEDYPVKTIGAHCDLIISVGGDGTFLAAARSSAHYQIPIIGVNRGRVGFLVDISPDDMCASLSALLSGAYQAEQRHFLEIKVIRNERVIHEEYALNEVVIHRWVTPSMIEIVTHINGKFLNSQRSDGLIIATPTGSTAYALSAGGAILHPTLKALMLVPLNPHTLSNRPIVMSDECAIEISFCRNKQINAQVTCDYLEIPEVFIHDKILIKKSANVIKILHPDNYDFFDVLRKKLHWSKEG
jgi:NAD+ kinase